MNRKESIEKFLMTVAFIFITLALGVIILTPPATGYEISIYAAYPTYFWFLLIATISCGVIIVVSQVFNDNTSNGLLIGLGIIIIANTVFLLLPELRGYVTYGRGDTLTHLGFIKDILNTGHVGRGNYYPIMHILGTSFIQIAGVPRDIIPSLFFVLFSGIYIVNMYLLARSVSNSNIQVSFVVAFASSMIYSFYHVRISPSVLSLFIVPCLLYVYHKRERLRVRQNTLLLILIAFFITFFHPLTTLYVIAVFFIFWLARVFHYRFLRHRMPKFSQYKIVGKNVLGVSLIMCITFFMWYFSYSGIQGSFRTVFEWLVYQSSPVPSLVQSMIDPLRGAGLTQLQTYTLFINKYGAVFLSLLISSLACISVLIKSLSRKHNVEPMKFIYATQFFIAIIIGVAMLLGYFVEYDPIRVARFSLLTGTIVSGLVVGDYEGFKKRTTKRYKSSVQRSIFLTATTAAIIVMVALSIGNVYESPRVYGTHHQVTKMNIAGAEWFVESVNPYIAVTANYPYIIRRFEDYVFGFDSAIAHSRLAERFPSHFGYDNGTIAEALEFKDRYIVLLEVDIVAPLVFPENVRPLVHQYTEEDLEMLNSDPVVAKLYTNGEFQVWRLWGWRALE